MADIPRTGSGNRRQPSRLQRRAPPPASLQITPSPIGTSPSRSCRRSSRSRDVVVVGVRGVQEVAAQPAAPFCYEPAPPVRPFVPV
ncbi:hypothetical protein M0R45_018362 [Rubus argutus]|uniref:Uncharacterized protein n=1 Tax=Rubus argutus TaxID=59490 RepID=A0AAW1X2C3_RUBAR